MINLCSNKGGTKVKENKYNDEKFFLKYSEMSRSKQGLEGAGEWSELEKFYLIFKISTY